MTDQDERFMQMAIDLAKQGEGLVEPNPMVGCVIVRDGEVIGSGAHMEFGGPHAEINALHSIASTGTDSPAKGATAYVTLEPCSHTGKTGPCADALIAAEVSRVVIAVMDPNTLVAGQGMKKLKEAGISVDALVLYDEAKLVLAPYLKFMRARQPWIIAKWAMTLDGKIATASGDSQWISNEQSREIVHEIRGRVDGVMVGIGTVLADDPMLNARPSGPRRAKRIVADSTARIPLDSSLVQTAGEFPTLVAVGPDASDKKLAQLKSAGCEIMQLRSGNANERLASLLFQLREQGMTNILVEGGGRLLGSLHDQGHIDEVHVFIGPKIIGGGSAPSPIAGEGKNWMHDSSKIDFHDVRQIGQDVYLVGRTANGHD